MNSNGKRIGYIRVSTTDQNPDRQLEGIQLDKKFIDYASAKSTNRIQLKAMMEFVREDDIIYIHSMDRLARNVRELRTLVDELVSRKIKVCFIKENLTFSNEDSAISNLLLSVIGAVAEFEHSFIRERQMEGIALAKKAGKYKGAKRKLNSDHIEILKNCIERQPKTKAELAKEMGVSRETLYRYIHEIKKQNIA